MGSGNVASAKRFRDDEDVRGTLVTDPSLVAYSIAGMKRSFLSTMNPRSALSAVRALRAGHVQGLTRGDNWQQGGILVVEALDRGGALLFEHASSEAGDPTDFRRVAAVLAELAVSP